jgi:hypothetical protein
MKIMGPYFIGLSGLRYNNTADMSAMTEMIPHKIIAGPDTKLWTPKEILNHNCCPGFVSSSTVDTG